MEAQHNSDWVNVNIGRLSKEQVANVVREARRLVAKLENVWPQGDSKQRGQLKVTLDKFGSYHIYLNHQALVCILLFARDIEDPNKRPDESTCPPDVPDFLRWDKPSDSTPV